MSKLEDLVARGTGYLIKSPQKPMYPKPKHMTLYLLENLEIHFFAKAFDAGTYLAFDGTNTKLYEEIRNELERWSRLGAPQ